MLRLGRAGQSSCGGRPALLRPRRIALAMHCRHASAAAASGGSRLPPADAAGRRGRPRRLPRIALAVRRRARPGAQAPAMLIATFRPSCRWALLWWPQLWLPPLPPPPQLHLDRRLRMRSDPNRARLPSILRAYGQAPGEFDRPIGIDFGPGGIMAVADAGNNRVQVFHPNGTLAFGIGSHGRDHGRFDHPLGIAFGPGGIIAVADHFNNRVQVFHPNGTFAFGIGSHGGGPGQFDGPDGVDFGPRRGHGRGRFRKRPSPGVPSERHARLPVRVVRVGDRHA